MATNSFTGSNSYKPNITGGNVSYNPNQLGGIQPLISDLLTEYRPNSYVKPSYSGDQEAINKRLSEYNTYDTTSMGGLADYFGSKAASRDKNQLYMKPADFEAASSNLAGIEDTRLAEMAPLLGGLNAVGGMGGNTYYEKSPFEQQMANYTTFDPAAYSNFSSVKDLKSLANIGGQNIYNKSDIEGLQNAKNYWGQEFDPMVSQLLGDKAGRDERGFYTTGLTDPTKFGIGDTGYQHRDIGHGKYEILGPNGEVLGTGYKSVQDTIRELEKSNPIDFQKKMADKAAAAKAAEEAKYAAMTPRERLLRQFQQAEEGQSSLDHQGTASRRYDAYGDLVQPTASGEVSYDWSDPDVQAYFGASSPVALAFGLNKTSPYTSGYGGAAADWEALGQLLGGAQGVSARKKYGMLPHNRKEEAISGANTLYGSTPVFYDGKLVGYKSDLGLGLPESTSTVGGKTTRTSPFGFSFTDPEGSNLYSTQLGRNIDPNSYQGLVQGLGGTEYFTPLENVEKLPGWTNTDKYNYQKVHQGLLGSLGFSPFLQQAIPMVLSAFYPAAGAILGGANAASKGDMKGVLGSLAGYGMNLGIQGTDFGLGATGNAAATGAIKGGVQGGIQGGGLKGIGQGALMGGIGGAAQNYFAPTSALGKIGMQGGLSGLNAAIQGGKFKDAALAGLISGGLGAAGNYLGQGISGLTSPAFGNTAGNIFGSVGSKLAQQKLAQQYKKRRI